jgi:hypothetical protein
LERWNRIGEVWKEADAAVGRKKMPDVRARDVSDGAEKASARAAKPGRRRLLGSAHAVAPEGKWRAACDNRPRRACGPNTK